MELYLILKYYLHERHINQSIKSQPSHLEALSTHTLNRTILNLGCQVNVDLDKSGKLFIRVSTPIAHIPRREHCVSDQIMHWG